MPTQHAGWGQRVAGWIFRACPAVLLGGFLCSLTVRPGLREDELKCEEAVAHLEECCPELDVASLQCRASGDCDAELPDFRVAESDCIRAASCDEIQARGLCAIRPVFGDMGNRDLDAGTVCP
jgi:hypothetical protein